MKLKDITNDKLIEAWGSIARNRPLIYHITNSVAVAYQANVTLAIGASPLMSQFPGEAAELTSIAAGLLINLGTPTPAGIESAKNALATANEKGKFTLLDPVGYGASKIRIQTTDEFLKKYKFSVIKGNAGEMSLLAGLEGRTRGVDSELSEHTALAVRKIASDFGCIACATGKTDFLSDGESVVEVFGGNNVLPLLSGSGCTAGSVIIACVAGSSNPAAGSLAGLIAMGIASERTEKNGAGTFPPAFLDSLNLLMPSDFAGADKRWRLI